MVPIADGVVSKWQFHRERLPLSFFDPEPPLALGQGTWLSAGLTLSKRCHAQHFGQRIGQRRIANQLNLLRPPTNGRDKEPVDVLNRHPLHDSSVDPPQRGAHTRG